jgi:ribonuclease-3
MKLLRRALELFLPSRLFRKKQPSVEPHLTSIQRILGHSFKDMSLLELSLRHKSAAAIDDRRGIHSNERLEFLGDAVLNCCVTEHLYHRFPDRSEGQLSKIKSLIVSRKILGEVAMAFDLGAYVHLGASERDSGGRHKPSIMSNAYEAVVGAIYLDGGIDAARRLLEVHLYPRIDTFLKEKSNINHKSKILELSQRDGFGVPQYSVLSTWGPEHAKTFRVQIEIGGVPMGVGTGPNKKLAQQSAAEVAATNYDKQRILDLRKGVKKDELVPH